METTRFQSASTCRRRFVCHCLQVTEAEIVEIVCTGEAASLREIRCRTGAGGGCTACHFRIERMIEQHCPASAQEPLIQVA